MSKFNRPASCRYFANLLVIGLFFGGVLAARAQGAATVMASPPDLSAFPQVRVLVDVRDANGVFVSGLSPQNLTVQEDGQESVLQSVEELRPGAQLTVAINPGQSFIIRDGQGISRYEYAVQALQVWATAQSASPDDRLSLLTPQGLLASHTTENSIWLEALAGYVPDTESFAPGLNVLDSALNQIAQETPATGMGRAILLITPVVSNESAALIPPLVERAVASGIRVHVWLIDSPQLFESANALALRDLALQSGGQYFVFSGSETIPDLYALFESSRRTYEVTYRSRLTSPGTHSLVVRVTAPQASASSEAHLFELALQPPNPVFVSMPGQVLRSIPEGERIAFENLQPTAQALEILIEFPDTIQRTIVRSALYADGELVAENTAPPFEFFTLDLTAFQSSQPLTLVAEAEDELGLVGQSIETPLQITVLTPSRGIMDMIRRNVGVIAAAAAISAGAALLLVLVLAGRLRPRTLSDSTRPRPASASDPVTQPVPVSIEPPAAARPGPLAALVTRLTAPRLRWPQRTEAPQPLAYLVRIGEDGEPLGDGVFSVITREVTFGSDPAQASVPLEDPAVEPVHARLWRDERGHFLFADQGSVAGAWINYAPVSREGSPVEHGDLLHIGRIGFRFTLSSPSKLRRARAIPLNGEDGRE